MRTIAIVNQKGGCGKTTVSINLASALAEVGKKVLLVDMDPQSHCAVGLAVPEEQIEQSIYDVLISKSRNEPMRLTEILWQIGDRLELAPASIDLSAFEQQMAGIPERECCLRNVLQEADSEYDYCVIDCPPAVGLLTFNALRAATNVLVPVETGYFALHGLSKQLETLSILCKRCQQEVSVRVLASMYDIRTKMAREILAELRSHFSDRMFKTVVNFNTKIKEAASFGQPVNEYDPASKGQQDFKALAEEVIGAAEPPQAKSKRLVDSLADQLESIGASANELLKATKRPETPEPEPTLDPKPLLEPKPTVNPKPLLDPKPVVQPKPTLEPKSALEPKPTVNPKPMLEPKPVLEANPTVQPKPTFDPKPTQPAPLQPVAEKDTFAPDPAIRLPNSAGAGVETKVTSMPPAREAVPAAKAERQPAPVIPIVATEPKVASFAETLRATDAKLSDYYGVNQIHDAVVFVTLYPRAQCVQIAGDFNNWQPTATPMERVGDSGVWQAKMKLPEGTYRYRLVVDGQWQQDPYNETSELNPYGELNSVVEIR